MAGALVMHQTQRVPDLDLGAPAQLQEQPEPVPAAPAA